MYTKAKEKFDVKAALDSINTGLKNINSNTEWLNFLAFQARFHSYSFGNTMLIYWQKPNASYVTGYSTWKSMNRFVKRGEKALKILAPIKYKVDEDEDKEDSFVLKGFKVVNVFDLSQTDGDETCVPLLIKRHKNNCSDIHTIYEKCKSLIEIPVIEKSNMLSKGSYDTVSKTISINSSYSDTQMLKSLIHEYAHHLHHTKYFNNEKRSICEVIAESSAYIVSKYLGIDCSDYSIPYIHGWADDISEFKSSCSKIQKIAEEIIKKLEPHSSSEAENREALNIYEREV